MHFLYFWPLALLILIPVIIIMYLLKQKAEDKPFSSLKLWRELYKNMQANTPWEKLKKNLLMIVQILTVIVIIAALMSPYIKSQTRAKGHIVLVIDTSGSMNTMYNERYTRLEAAVIEACAYVDNLAAGVPVSVITSDQESALIVADSTDKALIKQRLKNIKASNYVGDCSKGVSMAESMIAQWEDSEVVYFTDSYVSCKSTGGYVVSVYSDVDNAFIEYVGHGTGKDGLTTVIVKVVNNKKATLKTDINLYGDGEIIAVSEIEVVSGESGIAYFENIDFDGSILMAELNDANDALAADDVCYDVISAADAAAMLDVLLMTNQNLYLEKAVALIDGVNVTKSDDIDSFAEFEKDGYDMYIFDGMLPDWLPESGSILIFNCENDEIYTVAEEFENVLIKTEDTKYTKYLTDYSFGAANVKGMELPYWGESFLAVGEYSAGFIGNYNSQTICVVGFDVHDTELPLKTEFPILIYNIMEASVNTGMLSSGVLNSGSTVRVSGKLDGKLPVICYPDGSKTELSGNIANFTDTNDIGVYSVSQITAAAAGAENDELSESFVVNFPKSESVIKNTPMHGMSEGGTLNVVSASATAAAVSAFNLRNVIIVIALILLLLEWIIYIRG